MLAAPLCGYAADAPGRSGPQKTFSAPGDAAEALGEGYGNEDPKAVAEILGDAAWRLVFSGDAVLDRHERAWFLSLYREGHEVAPESADRAVLNLGRDEVPYPIPIVRHDGRWHFDPAEGHEDLVTRRIGKTELGALNALLSYVDAQRAYHSEPRRGDGVREFARKFRSTPGQRDGLTWEGEGGKAEGPLAGVIESAGQEGYSAVREGDLPIYRGYAYKVLEAQGAGAPGGSRDFVVGGRMTGGFALVAFPARYGTSGIMTFMVSQDGVIYQKDLGPQSGDLCRRMTRFDPDATWTRGPAN